jgi:hypothetical protein
MSFELVAGRLYVCDVGFEQGGPLPTPPFGNPVSIVVTAYWGDDGSVSKEFRLYVPDDPRKPLWVF